MMVVGLTGGIGSGKTSASHFFEQLGVPVIDADVIARQLVEPGQPALAAISERLGEDFINELGELKRAPLRQAMLNDSKVKLTLEAILHPLIQQEIKKQVKSLNSPYCIVVVPLLIENLSDYEWLDRILVIDCDKSVQLQRLLTRPGLDRASANQLIELQAKQDQRNARAHQIIVNDGSLADLRKQVIQLHALYSEEASKS